MVNADPQDVVLRSEAQKAQPEEWTSLEVERASRILFEESLELVSLLSRLVSLNWVHGQIDLDVRVPRSGLSCEILNRQSKALMAPDKPLEAPI